MNEDVQELLEKAGQSIGAAELLLKDGYIDFAASRAYYAMFYAVEALLLSRNLAFSKHSAVIAAFGKEFAKTGTIDPKYHRAILSAFDLRNAGDYGSIHSVSVEKAQHVIDDAHEMLIEIRQFIGDSR